MSKSNAAHTAAVILAAGTGSRMRADTTKQRMLLLGKSVIYRTVAAFYASDSIDSITVVGRSEEMDFLRTELTDFKEKLHAVVVGGDSRTESASIGFKNIPECATHVAIHDGARPLVTAELIDRVVASAIEHGAATAASPIFDTVKRVKDGIIVATENRDELYRAETPQVFGVDIYSRALQCDADGVTDDNMLVERTGVAVHAVISGTVNLKITAPSDIKYAEFILKERDNV